MAKTTSTINGKTTKTGLIAFLSDSLKKVTDSNLKQRMEYTLKKAKKDLEGTAKSDLYDLAKEVMSLLSAPEAPKLAVVENSTKPKLGKKSKKVEEPAEAEMDEDDAVEPEKEEAPKKGKKKSLNKSKDSKKKAEVETTDGGLTSKELPMAKVFPKEFDHEGLGHLVACPDKYRTMDEIREALKNGVELVFATYWTKRHLKEFSYAIYHEVTVPKGGFPYDLDTLQALYVCDSVDRVYALSTYTEAMFRIEAVDLEPVECVANDGSKFLMRYTGNLEFEIYELVTEQD